MPGSGKSVLAAEVVHDPDMTLTVKSKFEIVLFVLF
jgi:hypothetical protein